MLLGMHGAIRYAWRYWVCMALLSMHGAFRYAWRIKVVLISKQDLYSEGAILKKHFSSTEDRKNVKVVRIPLLRPTRTALAHLSRDPIPLSYPKCQKHLTKICWLY